uniref:Uncharacterized protein n=1 Tax=Arundo donax TaxID=35708 RepID=A0A0A8Z716_ARUDO
MLREVGSLEGVSATGG